MKKTAKTLLATLLALTMLCALALPVWAANEDISGHDFKAYQVFSGKVAAKSDEPDKLRLSDINWGSGVDGTALLNDVKNISGFGNVTSAADVAKILENKSETSDEVIAFSKYAAKHLTDTAITSTGTNSIQFTDAGYYLIVDTTEVQTISSVANISLLRVIETGKTYEVNSKVEKPSFTPPDSAER